MRRRVLIGALLLVGVGVVLGATVFRTDIAQATGLAQSVTVANTPSNPVPVQQQGTASVNVTNTSLAVHDQATTQLLATGTVSDTNTSLPDIDVSGYKEVRVSASFIACNPARRVRLPVDRRQGGRNRVHRRGHQSLSELPEWIHSGSRRARADTRHSLRGLYQRCYRSGRMGAR